MVRAVSRATVVAIDVGATNTKAAVVDKGGRRLLERRVPTRGHRSPSEVRSGVLRLARELVELAPPGARPSAVGIAVCGTVDPGGSVTAVNLNWVGEALLPAARAELGLPVVVLNDAHAGALGEGAHGSAQGVQDYVYVSLGTGIGAAVVQGGELVDGAHGRAGELGHVTVDPAGRRCSCGGSGCVETIMSARALERQWQETHGTRRTMRQLIGMVADGEPSALALWLAGVDALARALVGVMSLVDPETIVLGGGLAAAGGQLLSPLQASVKEHARAFQVPAELRLAALGDWSGCAGAGAAAWESLGPTAR